jgi:DNA-binding MarR family transcriptional regulator
MTDADPRQIWAILGELVLDNERRREVSEAVGLSFGKVRAIRRIARRPRSMSDLAASLGIDPPNATTVVDELERLGLAQRQPHPTDRRAKIVTATRKGILIARRADEILSSPPPGLTALSSRDLDALERIVLRIRDHD